MARLFAAGDTVRVLFNGRYYKATIQKVAKTRLKIKYACDGSFEHIMNADIPSRIKSASASISQTVDGDASGAPGPADTYGRSAGRPILSS